MVTLWQFHWHTLESVGSLKQNDKFKVIKDIKFFITKSPSGLAADQRFSVFHHTFNLTKSDSTIKIVSMQNLALCRELNYVIYYILKAIHNLKHKDIQSVAVYRNMVQSRN